MDTIILQTNSFLRYAAKVTGSQFILLLIAISILSSILLPKTGWADGTKLTPSLEIVGGYDDNVLFSSTEPLKAFYTIAKPEVEFGVDNENYGVAIDAYVELVRYENEKDLDTENFRME